jgi:mono/diheme cytochrome c family protein
MIWAVLFVLLFLVLGLSVVFVAMSGGARGARRSLQTRSRRGGKLLGLATAVVIVGLGIAVPLAIGLANGSDKASNAPGGVELNADQTNGRTVFAQKCSTCHTLAASNAVGKVGPDLDVLRPMSALVLNAIQQGRARGQGQMPAGLVTGQDARDVAGYVAAVAGRG